MPSYYSPYGSLSLTESSPQQSWDEAVTIEEVKAQIQCGDFLPADQQVLIEDVYIPGAREQAEILQGRDLVRKQYDLALDYWPCSEIELRDPLVSVDRVRYRDSNGDYTTLIENTDYIVDSAKHPGVILPAYSKTWPSFTAWPSSAISLRFTSGLTASSMFWSDAGKRVKIGMLLLISEWYNNRLPFALGDSAIQEYPFAVTACLSFGALRRVA